MLIINKIEDNTIITLLGILPIDLDNGLKLNNVDLPKVFVGDTSNTKLSYTILYYANNKQDLIENIKLSTILEISDSDIDNYFKSNKTDYVINIYPKFNWTLSSNLKNFDISIIKNNEINNKYEYNFSNIENTIFINNCTFTDLLLTYHNKKIEYDLKIIMNLLKFYTTMDLNAIFVKSTILIKNCTLEYIVVLMDILIDKNFVEYKSPHFYITENAIDIFNKE